MKSIEERQAAMRDETTTAVASTRPALTVHELGESLTKEQAAEILQVSPRQVQRWIAERKLRASRLSHKVLRIRRKDLEQFLDRFRV